MRQTFARLPLAPVAFLAVTLVVALAFPVPSAAQTPAPPLVSIAGWQNGFFLQSSDGLNRLQIGLLVQADGRVAFETDGANGFASTFAFRRLRPYFRGRIADRFEFYLNPDFAGGTLVVQDAYVDTRFSTAFRLRVGKAKTPFGHERLHSSNSLLFLDRASPTALAPNRDVGIQALGDLAGGMVSYLIGVGNGAPDGGSVETDTNDSKDVAARVVVRPFRKAPDAPLGGLGFALSGSTGTQTGAAALPAYRTSIIAQTFFSYAGSVADGTRHRYSPYVFYYGKAFGAFSEYVRSELPVRKADIREVIGHEAWQVAGSVVLTGEAATEGGVRPAHDFDFGGGHWGALQVTARYHTVTVDRRAIDLGLAALGSSGHATAWTIGLNWYLSSNLKYVFNGERWVFDGDPDGPRPPENVFAFRTQFSF
jgi:phosphate-selective porin OprO/OprP